MKLLFLSGQPAPSQALDTHSFLGRTPPGFHPTAPCFHRGLSCRAPIQLLPGPHSLQHTRSPRIPTGPELQRQQALAMSSSPHRKLGQPLRTPARTLAAKPPSANASAQARHLVWIRMCTSTCSKAPNSHLRPLTPFPHSWLGPPPRPLSPSDPHLCRSRAGDAPFPQPVSPQPTPPGSLGEGLGS